MKILKIASAIVVIGIVLFWLMLMFLTVDIPAGMVGVRTQEFGFMGPRGVVAKDFGPGWHRDFGVLDSWEFYDATVQTLEMTRDPEHGSRRGKDDVAVTSSDGYLVSVDVTVKYRIKPGEAHLLRADIGPGLRYQEIVRNQARNACMDKLGQMTTEQFYDPTERMARTKEIQTLLGENLTKDHIEVIAVLLRDVQFDPDYEEKIRNKKLADQEVEVNRSMAKAEEMAGKTQVIEAETARLVRKIEEDQKAEIVRLQATADLKIATLKAEAERYASEKRADADLLQAQKEAEGDRLMKLAEAEGEKLRNEALAGNGGRVIAAIEAAKNLKVGSVTVSTTQTDLMDLDAMASKLGAPEATETKAEDK
jgi:regulator of protease activity HflC (stomatin/prohibitin superfamily)